MAGHFRNAAALGSQDDRRVKRVSERTALAAGALATLFAGACCLGPLVIVTLGFGGAWLSNLQRFEPYKAVFVAVALAALAWAGWRIYRPAACEPGGVCAVPWVRRGYRIAFWLVAVLLAIVLIFPYLAPYFY